MIVYKSSASFQKRMICICIIVFPPEGRQKGIPKGLSPFGEESEGEQPSASPLASPVLYTN